jgi:hypothetical protein
MQIKVIPNKCEESTLFNYIILIIRKISRQCELNEILRSS